MKTTPQPRLISRGDVLTGLATVGRDRACRTRLLAALRELEAIYPDKTVDVRETLTGPIADRLFESDELLQKRLISGLTFWFRYRSKSRAISSWPGIDQITFGNLRRQSSFSFWPKEHGMWQ
jgi:hypothetical protein